MMADITVCVKCKHHCNTHDGSEAGPSSDSWFYHICTHPELEHPTGVDPVTGKTMHFTQNDMGRSYFCDDPHPYCQNVNDGSCKHFERRT